MNPTDGACLRLTSTPARSLPPGAVRRRRLPELEGELEAARKLGRRRWRRRSALCAGSKEGDPTVQSSDSPKPLLLPPQMEVCDEVRSFEATGVYRLDGTCSRTGATFLDPVRLLNASYQRFRIVPSAYYSRSFGPPHQEGEPEIERPEKRRKRKGNQKPKSRELNPMEQIAEARHQVMCYTALLWQSNAKLTRW